MGKTGSSRSVVAVRAILLGLLACPAVRAQVAPDTTLFTISLCSDSSSLFFSDKNSRIRSCLSGPVVMADRALLFCSINGYVLYNQRGEVVDSQTVFEENKGLAERDPKRLRMAYPIDTHTVLFFRETPGEKRPLEILQKKLYKKKMKELKEDETPRYPEIAKSLMFNLAHNTITDEMAARSYLAPQLVGFGSPEQGERWWTLDRFYGFSSPLIHEDKGAFRSFFPGIREDASKGEEGRGFSLDALALFTWENRTCYVGVLSSFGGEDYKHQQTVYICDQAGNVMYADTMLKQLNYDEVLGKDKDNDMLFYTARATKKFVFPPSVDRQGTFYYGVVDYVDKKLTVCRRAYVRYVPQPSEPDLALLFDAERQVAYEPPAINCNFQQNIGATIPTVFFADDKGERRKADVGNLTKDGFVVRISRQLYRDLERKVSRKDKTLPATVAQAQDSLLRLSTTGCPYAISLSGPGGALTTFYYAAGDNVLCARVLAVRSRGDVVVRVDCQSYAEVLLFRRDGTFINRFVFNRQSHTQRRDLVAASPQSEVVELDYERDPGRQQYLKWTASGRTCAGS